MYVPEHINNIAFIKLYEFPPPAEGGGGVAGALAIFEPFLRGCTPDQAGLFGVGTSQTDPSIA